MKVIIIVLKAFKIYQHPPPQSKMSLYVNKNLYYACLMKTRSGKLFQNLCGKFANTSYTNENINIIPYYFH